MEPMKRRRFLISVLGTSLGLSLEKAFPAFAGALRGGRDGSGKMLITPPFAPAGNKVQAMSAWAARYRSVPADFLDKRGGENRVNLRSAAQLDPKTRLAIAAVGSVDFGPIHTQLPSEAVSAYAQLAVTGRRAFAAFAQWHPKDAELISYILNLSGPTGDAGRKLPPATLQANVKKVLGIAYTTANILRGKDSFTYSLFMGSPWMAVSGEDDPPHRPVNVPSAPFPQYDIAFSVNGSKGPVDVTLRYTIASTSNRLDTTAHPVGPVEFGYTLPSETPSIPASDKIILYIHGDGSRLEEAMDLIPALHAVAKRDGKEITVISFDLPTSGYSSMIEHTTVAPSSASNWPNGFPILDFIERCILGFADALDQQIGNVKDRIVAVVGGSLGGNMCFRLGRNVKRHPWTQNIVAWSPASVWNSYHDDALKGLANNKLKGRMDEAEKDSSRQNWFHTVWDDNTVDILGVIKLPPTPQMWYRDDWPPKQTYIQNARLERQEIYNAAYRRWTWRLDYEQLIYSHLDKDASTGQPRYLLNTANMRILAGKKDHYDWTDFDTATEHIARLMVNTPGEMTLVLDTGHSIHNERPGLLADVISQWIQQNSPGGI